MAGLVMMSCWVVPEMTRCAARLAMMNCVGEVGKIDLLVVPAMMYWVVGWVRTGFILSLVMARTRLWMQKIMDAEIGDVLILYDIDSSRVTQSIDGGKVEIGYGDGDYLTVDEFDNLELLAGTLGDLHSRAYLEREGIDPASRRVNGMMLMM